MSRVNSSIETTLPKYNIDVYSLFTWRGALAVFLLYIVASISLEYLTGPRLPYVNYNPLELTHLPAKFRYLADSRGLLTRGFEKFKGPFQLITDAGPMIIFQPSHFDQLNVRKELDFELSGEKSLFGKYPGFEAFRVPPHGLMEEVIRIKITRNLPKFTAILSRKLDEAMETRLTNETEWHDVGLKDEVLKVIAQISALVFVGEKLAHNADWLKISVDYTVSVFTAAFMMRLVPTIFAPIAQYLIPQCYTVRREMAKAKELITAVIREREAEEEAAIARGEEPKRYEDAISWAKDAAKGRPYNETGVQMTIAVAAIHTTSDLICQAIYNLCEHPELIAALREEAASILSRGGWQKSSLLDMHLLDSFLKETQRLKPVNTITMNRMATEAITLADGTHIPKGTITAMSTPRLMDPSIYAEPETFDAYRFLRWRQDPKLEHKAALSSTSLDHTGFSHGRHACPGRFFAANEVKITLVHFLLKYDFKYGSGKRPKVLVVGSNMVSDGNAKIAIRRRDEEIVVPKE